MAINRIKTGGITDGTIQSGDIAPGTIASDRLEGNVANAKLANSSITINGTAVSLGGSVTAGTDWQAVTVADGSTTLTAEAGKGYFLDTNTGVIEVFLPTSPSRGDTILIADYAGTFATNNVIINTGTNNLDSTTTRQYKLTTNDTIAEFVFVDSAKGYITRILQAAGTTPSGVFTDGIYDRDQSFIEATGGTVLTVGNFKTHVFTGDGSFAVSAVGSGGPATENDKVDYMVIAGGGGTFRQLSSGGGAGGMRLSNVHGLPSPTMSPLSNPTGITVTATSYPITVGGGGSPGPAGTAGGATNGSNSVFSTITSTGGGKGGSSGQAPGDAAGSPGGSGAGGDYNSGTSSGGNGNTPPVSPPQGNNGGTGSSGPSLYGPGGGGGAGGTGTSFPQSPGGNSNGGLGSYINAADYLGPTAPSYGTPGPVSGTRYFAGGGAGAKTPSNGTPAATSGGGGDGTSGASTGGDANTGGGGGGTHSPSCYSGGAGGKGIVLIRYRFQ